MKRLFNHPKFPTILFVSASILSLVLLIIVFFGFNFVRYLVISSNFDKSRYYFDEDALESQGDPLVTKVPNFEDALVRPLLSDSDPSLGAKSAPVTIVQFSDFECTFCREQEYDIKKIIKEFGDNVRLVWKDFPDKKPLSQSFRSAVAARCAQKQNRFWEYHDLLFKESGSMNDDTYFNLAKKLSFNLNDFQECIKNPTNAQPVLDNIYEANALNISGIPFVYVNGREIMGMTGYDELKKIVESELNINVN